METRGDMYAFQEQFTRVASKFNHISPAAILDDFVQLMCVIISSNLFHTNLFKQPSPGRLYADPHFRSSLDDSGRDHPTGYREALNELTRDYIFEVYNSEHFADILGPVYELHSAKQSLEQFFTPPSIATLLAEMSIGHVDKNLTGENSSVINDSSCGAGALLLAHLRKIYQSGNAAAISRVEVYANDIDLSMCKIVTVQIIMSSALKQTPLKRLQVSNGDTLLSKSGADSNAVVYDWLLRVEQFENASA